MMNVSFRVHIMPVGYETERVYESAKKYSAEKVVLIKHEQPDDQAEECVDEVERKLEKYDIEYDFAHCDIFDLYDSIGTIAQTISEHANHDIHVNLSTGSKVTAIAGMIACMATNAKPYYVKAEDYGDLSVATGISDINELPAYHMDTPQKQQILILDHLASEGPLTKIEIIEFGEEHDLPFIANRDISADKAKYGPLEDLIGPILERDWAKSRRIGREKQVQITERGEDTLKAFRYLIE
ncbi:HFX_2341 family transcriptional regulator domain-containing protein [Natronoarchaeum rubrum]|uniref:HFX_2341 family transcriptional regulator domain-containing protein n=1 Tax=Natronoarchaeum rubrum TaxID=755311 RepID=UPI0021114091|nr:DUF6293 family protein [Natronoarchaeum rubrum]